MKVYERSDPKYQDQLRELQYWERRFGDEEPPDALQVTKLAMGDIIVLDHEVGPDKKVTALVIGDGDHKGKVAAMYLSGGWLTDDKPVLPYPFQATISRITKLNGLPGEVVVDPWSTRIRPPGVL